MQAMIDVTDDYSVIAGRQFEDAMKGGYPRMWKGQTMMRFPLEAYLQFADEAGDDGGSVHISRPRKGPQSSGKANGSTESSFDVFDGHPELQNMVDMPLADFLALVAGRSDDGDERSKDVDNASAASFRQHAEPAAVGQLIREPSLYGCQIVLAGAGGASANDSPLRQALASGAKACIPTWATKALEAADAAMGIHQSEGPDSRDRDESLGEIEVEVASINAWLCAGGVAKGPGCPTQFRTETHYDGYQNMMMVLEGCKTVRIWPCDTHCV